MHPFVAKLARSLKTCVFLLPILVLAFLITVSMSPNGPIALNANQRQTPPSNKTTVTDVASDAKKVAVKTPQSLTSHAKLERSRACESNDTKNATVLAACEELANAKRKYYTPRDSIVNPFPHRFLIDAAHLCRAQIGVVILVHSLHNYSDRRQAIRETWGGAAVTGNWPRASVPFKVTLAFVLGLNHNPDFDALLKVESEKYGDIIQGDFYEDYSNMTLKSLLGLKWVKDYCPRAKFLIKSDDDMIINIPYLLRTLARTNMTWALLGPNNEYARVMRRGKWSIPNEVFPFYFYPAYESGAAYVISGDLVSPLFNISQYVPPIFIDDVYITGILAEVLRARHVKIYGFSYWNSKRLLPCDIITDRMFTGTKMTPSFQVEMWKTILTGRYCR